MTEYFNLPLSLKAAYNASTLREGQGLLDLCGAAHSGPQCETRGIHRAVGILLFSALHRSLRSSPMQKSWEFLG